MARAALQLGVRDLVELATVAKLERGEALSPRTLPATRTALEATGVDFIPKNRRRSRVRLRKSSGPWCGQRREAPPHEGQSFL